MNEKWDKRFLELANHIATWSKDRSTKVGAVIVDDDKRVLSLGYNGFPTLVDDDIENRHIRPQKYKWTEHAERNAIYSASRLSVSLKSSSLYCNYFPCPDCARAIIQSGIKRVVYQYLYVNSLKEGEKTKIDNVLIASNMFEEANINFKQYNL